MASSKPPIPEGAEYLDLIDELEARCEKATEEYLPHAGETAPNTSRALGTYLSILDRLSSCWWHCPGGDHSVQYLVARVVGSLRAALRLMRAGLYDEALNALRTSAVVNLLRLFALEPELLDRWRAAEEATRFGMARPTQVIKRLRAAGLPNPLDGERYDLLSRIAHGNMSHAPQAYNAIGLPLTAGHFQEAGRLVVLNESATIGSIALVAALELIPLGEDIELTLLKQGRELAKDIGAVDLTNVRIALARRTESTAEQEVPAAGEATDPPRPRAEGG
jgi:hypothetical protein